jgi:hypothetical protein
MWDLEIDRNGTTQLIAVEMPRFDVNQSGENHES